MCTHEYDRNIEAKICWNNGQVNMYNRNILQTRAGMLNKYWRQYVCSSTYITINYIFEKQTKEV